MPQSDRGLLVRLKEHGVEFLIMGGMCGEFRILTLETHIIAKESLGRERDLPAAKLLRD